MLLLVGYGTKMGLAPLHTWLPDAHSESPSVVSALLSGALLNCAFSGHPAGNQVCAAAGLAAFGAGFAGALRADLDGRGGRLHRRPDRLQAAAGLFQRRAHGHPGARRGLGGAGGFGAMLHAVNHSLTKAMLFLSAGNILAAYGTKTLTGCARALRRAAGVGRCCGWRASWRSPGRRRSGRS